MAGTNTPIEPEFPRDKHRVPIPVLGPRFGAGVDTATSGATTSPVRHKLGTIAAGAYAVFPTNGLLTSMAGYRFTIALEGDIANGIPPNVYYRFGTAASIGSPAGTDAVDQGWGLAATAATREFVRKVPLKDNKIAIQNPGGATIRVFAERMD